MRKLVVGAAMCAGALLAGAPLASAMPFAPAPNASPDVTLVYGGCGPMGHRGPYGGCRPGGQWGGYVPGRACPPGFHLGPYGRKCWPNRY